MGRKAAISYEQVKAVVDALRAEGAKPTIDQVWEAFDKAGSKGTVHKLVKQYLAELDESQKTPESLRLLPPHVQQVILSFADQVAAAAREKVADGLLESTQEASSLASDNERLTAELDRLRMELGQAMAEQAATEGRAAQLATELAVARDQISAEHTAAEQARTALAKAELRLEAVGRLEEEIHRTRTERDAQREAREVAERTAAVLGSQQKQHQERVQDIKTALESMRDACARLETKNRELTEALEREREMRTVAERGLAVSAAVQAERASPVPKSKSVQVKQGALWQGDGEVSNGS